jgi:molybdopterin converting factor small subunit
MRIRVLSSNLAEIIGKEIEINIEGEITLDELKSIIVEKFPRAKDEINDIFYNFSINGELVKRDEMKNVKIKDRDLIIIFPSIAGG